MLKEPFLSAADVNGDGAITLTDLAKIQLHHLGLEKL